jgi:hypothetical protein
MLHSFRLLPLAVALLVSLPATAGEKQPSVGERWERALLDAKRAGTLSGPKPGQRCLWSRRLGACLWYTPSKFNEWRD